MEQMQPAFVLRFRHGSLLDCLRSRRRFRGFNRALATLALRRVTISRQKK
jgi:hypothetical protein